MNFSQFLNLPKINHPINGEGTVYYFFDKYTGRWENGMKVGEGIFERDLIKLKIKTKKGEMYKCTQILNFPDLTRNKINVIPLPRIKFTKVGTNYIEEYSESENLSFSIKDGKLLFDAKAYPIVEIHPFKLSSYDFILGKLKDSKFSILDYKSRKVKFDGYTFNLTPNGNCKIIFEYIKIKGKLTGKYFNGPCIVKFPDFKIIYETCLNIIKFPVKVLILSSKTELFFTPSANKILHVEVDELQLVQHHLEQMLDSIQYSSTVLRQLTNGGIFSQTTSIVSYSLVIDTSWALFERKIPIKCNEFNLFVEKKHEFTENDEKCLKVFLNNERYEGRVVRGKFEGFGKYFYADGSVYIGEFKNNLRNGLGTFRFIDGRIYRGNWADNLMHGKGCMVIKKMRMIGIWERNQMKLGSFCKLLG